MGDNGSVYLSFIIVRVTDGVLNGDDDSPDVRACK